MSFLRLPAGEAPAPTAGAVSRSTFINVRCFRSVSRSSLHSVPLLTGLFSVYSPLGGFFGVRDTTYQDCFRRLRVPVDKARQRRSFDRGFFPVKVGPCRRVSAGRGQSRHACARSAQPPVLIFFGHAVIRVDQRNALTIDLRRSVFEKIGRKPSEPRFLKCGASNTALLCKPCTVVESVHD